MSVNLCMTSWAGRIKDIKPVLDSLFNQTYKDFTLWLTLSSEEFENKALPDFLNSNKDHRLMINWIGPNFKTMKKVFPVLPYLSDEDLIITVDDDVIFDEKFVELRVAEFEMHGKKTPLASNRRSYQFSVKAFFSSCGSLFTKNMLKGYDVFVNDEVLKTYDDDWAYSFIILLNGYRFKPCENYTLQEFKFINQDASSKDNTYNWRKTIPVIQKRIADFVGKQNFNDFIYYLRHNLVTVDWQKFKENDKAPNYVFNIDKKI